MKKKGLVFSLVIITLSSMLLSYGIPSYIKERILNLTSELEYKAQALAETSYSHFRGWNGVIDEREQKVLFSSESFLASVRLFRRFINESSTYFHSEYTRTNLFSAFSYMANYFYQLKRDMESIGLRPYEVYDIERILRDIEREFSSWSSPDNLSYLNGYYVKGYGSTVYVILKLSPGRYEKRPFKNLESLFAYTYFYKRKKENPWKFLKKISLDLLSQIPEGPPISMTFEGHLVIQMGKGPGRPVYLIKNGKKRPLANPSVLRRFGGWGNVYEVPKEVIDKYPTGKAIK